MKKSELRQIIREEIKFLKEEEPEEDGMKSRRGTLYGTKSTRIVIEGPGAEKNKSEILKIIKKQDPDHKVQFFPATKKFVGTFSHARIDSLKRDLKDKDVTVVEKSKSQSLKKLN